MATAFQNRKKYAVPMVNPHLKTFDGATYDITGTCEYYMVISTKESANQSPFNVRFKSFRRKPKEMVPWIETVWFEFKSRDYKSTFVIEMSRNKISKSIDTIVTQSTGSGESEKFRSHLEKRMILKL